MKNFHGRRNFIRQMSAFSAAPYVVSGVRFHSIKTPLIISTWDFGLAANQAAAKVLDLKGSALDAVETGVMVPEGDPLNNSVGYGGLPDRDGIVTLDACIMDHKGRAGSVCALENIVHPIGVARKVMENSPHVMLAGAGALQFAIQQGFSKENLLTEKSRLAWEEWKKTSQYSPVINIENHDTIGMIAMDHSQNIAGACTTSGLAYKMHGRVGDSPVIGSGLYVDNEIGAATGTGLGELVLRQCSTFLIVELMRMGRSPQSACEEAIKRIVAKNKNYKEIQVGFIAFNRKGNIGAYSIQPGFTYALYQSGKHTLNKSKSYLPA